MTPNDILTLAKAGFNSQQIGALLTITNKKDEVPPVPPVPPVPTVPTVPPVPSVPPVPPVPPVPQQDLILAEIQKLTGVVQKNALIGTNIDKPQETADDILAQIINPVMDDAVK